MTYYNQRDASIAQVVPKKSLKVYNHNLLDKKMKKKGKSTNVQTNKRANPPTPMVKNKSDISCL